MGPSKPPNKAEKERMDKLSRMPCPACLDVGYRYYVPVQIHHLLRGNKRMGHWWTLPLCEGHHMGRFTDHQAKTLHPEELVAVSDGRKIFESVYGTERGMWTRLQLLNGWDDTWPTDKIVRRKAA